MRPFRTAALGGVLLAGCAVAAGAQSVTGRVVDEHGVSVARAEVQVLPSGRPVLTDASGKFNLGPLPVGTDSIRVRRVGFVVTVAAVIVRPTTERLTIVLHHAAAMLDTVRTSAIEQRLPRAFERVRAHIGTQLYGPALDSMFARGGSRSLMDMLTVDRRFAFTVERPHGGDFCVFVDGIPVSGPIESYISQKEISMMETFDGTDPPVHESFPFEHLVGAHWVECGRVVLIWSRYYQQPPWQGH